ncbi:MAG: SH3 domain-containing protein [Terriglobales bacterium]
MRLSSAIPNILLMCLLAVLLLGGGCKRGKKLAEGDPAYVTAPQVSLRDRLSAIYNRTGIVKNGEKIEVLERSKRFARVRSPRGEEGWMEARYLVGPEIAEALEQLAKENANTPVQAHGTTRAELKMHVTPGRDTDSLYRAPEGAKLDLLKRATAAKPQPKVVPVKEEERQSAAPPAPILEDWWLGRDTQGRVGWVLARMVDIDVPLEIAQYAEGQRIMAAFVLNKVPDVNEATGEVREVPQYLTIVNEPKDGTPWDFNQIRVFTWNAKRHRYETAYRERNLYGVFPVTVGHEVFEREGDLPVFTLRVKDDSGNIVEKRYKLNQPLVRRVLSPEEQKAEEAKRAARLQEALQRRAARKRR